MGKIFCITNQKGGVGKTTTAVNLGIGLRHHEKEVLLIDLDPQASLTSAIGLKNSNFEYTIYDLLKGNVGVDRVTLSHKGSGVKVIPSGLSLSGADIELSAVPARELLLKEALEQVSSRYDCIIIDCPPSLGLLTLNALTAADAIFIPIQAEYLPLEGVKFLLESIDIVRKRLNQKLEIAGVLVTLYDPRQILQREVFDAIRGHFKDKVFNTFIRKNVSLAEAPGFGQDIYTYRPDSTGAEDYARLCREFIQREVI